MGVGKSKGKYNPNPRRENGWERTQLKKRIGARKAPCALCLKPIDYSLKYPHKDCYVLDEIRPVSKWREYGYRSAKEAALDPKNVQPAHNHCNSERGNMTMEEWWAKKRKRADHSPEKQKASEQVDALSEW